MNRKISLGNALALCMLLITLTFSITAVSFQTYYASELQSNADRDRAFSKLYKIDQLISSDYIGSKDNDKLSDGVAMGYMSGLGDKYGYYLNKENTKALYEDINGKSEGIGIGVKLDESTGYPLIVEVYEGSPAAEQGVASGDLISTINGKDVLEMGYYKAVNELKGSVGTIARFSVLRAGNEYFIEAVRAKYDKKSVTYKLSDNIGIVRVSQFGTETPDEFKSAIDDLKAKGATALIFDLRNNVGGELQSICSVLDYILPEGPIVRINYKNKEQQVINSDRSKLDVPFCVLINGQTYSAAELFAAAVKDYKAGLIIGEKSYGKGRMQTVMNLGDGTALNFTTATFDPPYSPNFDGVGVLPDIEVKSVPTDGADPQLEAAVKALKDKGV